MVEMPERAWIMGWKQTVQLSLHAFLFSLGYVDIGLIPKGARDIRVMEVEGAGNFLAIRSEDPEKYYLNG